jgi:hypothetical protein
MCQIESKEDSSTSSSNNVTTDMNVDGIYLNGDQQQQSLMRPHPAHVKVTLILSRNYSLLYSFLFLIHLHIHSFRF